MVDHFQDPLEEAKGHPPHDVTIGITDDDAGEAHIRQLRDDMLDLPGLFVETRQREPECLLDLSRVEGELLMGLDIEGVGRHDEARTDSLISHVIVDLPEILGTRELDADFFEGLASGGDATRGIRGFHPTAGKGHVPGPRIALENGTLDQQDLGGVDAFTQHDGDGSAVVFVGGDELRRVQRQFSSHVFDIHRAERSGLARPARASALHSG